MANLEQVLKLLPYSLTHDPVVVAMYEAAIIQLQEVYEEADALVDLVNVDKLPEPILDLIAYEKHVDFYDNELTLNQKRELIKSSISWHRKKGTRWAVENVVSKVYPKAEVFEWFEYDGNKYRFKVQLNLDAFLSRDFDIRRLKKLIDETKNKRSWLDNNGIILKGIIINKILILNRVLSRIRLKTTSNPWAFVGSGGYGSEKIILDGKYNLDGKRFLNSFYNTSGPDNLAKIRLVLKVLNDFGTEVNIAPILDGEYHLDGKILLQNELQTVRLPVIHEVSINYKQREIIDVSSNYETQILCSSKSISGVHTLNGANDLNGTMPLDQALLENSGFLRVKKSGVTIEEVAI